MTVRKYAAVSSIIGMILCWMMLRIKCIPETFSAEIECVTIQTGLSKRRPGVVSRIFFFILEPIRIFYGLRITLTIEKSRHRVKNEIALLTKLPGAFDIPSSHRHVRRNVIFCFYSTADTPFSCHTLLFDQLWISTVYGYFFHYGSQGVYSFPSRISAILSQACPSP